jgi:hypothetical protein
VRPQPSFCIGHVAPQFARDAGQSLFSQYRTPIPNPLALCASFASPQGEGLWST